MKTKLVFKDFGTLEIGEIPELPNLSEPTASDEKKKLRCELLKKDPEFLVELGDLEFNNSQMASEFEMKWHLNFISKKAAQSDSDYSSIKGDTPTQEEIEMLPWLASDYMPHKKLVSYAIPEFQDSLYEDDIVALIDADNPAYFNLRISNYAKTDVVRGVHDSVRKLTSKLGSKENEEAKKLELRMNITEVIKLYDLKRNKGKTFKEIVKILRNNIDSHDHQRSQEESYRKVFKRSRSIVNPT